MSRRLLQRGRYPKGPGVDQITNPSPQFSQTTLNQCPVTSEVPYYPPVQPQTPQNVWMPPYSNPSTFQQNQAPQPPPVSEQSNYWSPNQMYPMHMQQTAPDPWNWKPGNSSENTVYPNYQEPQQLVAPSTESWQQVPQPRLENQNYVHPPITHNPLTQQSYEPPVDCQSMNNNSSNFMYDTSLQSWENNSLNITQPAQLPWTYSAPQYCNPSDHPTTELATNTATSNVSWIHNNSFNASYSETSNIPPSNYLTSETNVVNGAVNIQDNVPPQNITNEIPDQNLSCIPESDYSNVNKDSNVVDPEFGSSSLSAFFQNSEQNTSTNNSEYGGTSTPEVKHTVDSSSLEENIARLQINESEKSSVPTEDEQDDGNLEEDTDDGGNQEINFIQAENSNNIEIVTHSNTVSPAFVEEPVNQEVPEPSSKESNNLPLQVTQRDEDYHKISPEEPFNQQIPEDGEKSRSTSSERERVVIRAREESPFKPPRMNNNSKGTVVQQEIPVQNVQETDLTENKTVVQAVNLETFPDNLERPPDYEELRKQSSFYVSHQKHLRTELNSSPSSLLCDNPDIPCVTLAPAAPPIHSSAKSDKSESSTDSRREMASFEKPTSLANNIKELNHSSPAGLDSELNGQSSTLNQSSPKESTERKSNRPSNITNSSSSTRQQESPIIEQNNPPLSKPYLKESKINDVRTSEQYRKPGPSAENLETVSKHTNNSQSYSSQTADYSLRSKMDPRYPYPDAEYNRQKFADRKYPSFDERQYYSDRERSRPPSRSSLDDRSEDYMYNSRRRDNGYPPDDRHRGPSDYGRPPSRMSESDMNRVDRRPAYDYYTQQQYSYQEPYSRNQDYYQRSRNHPGYEYDPYYASYYDAYRYAYSNYNYGFYDELYRNDPRYQHYQQYRQYYNKYGYEGGEFDRSSAHSGRSSANELSKDMSSMQYTEQDVDSNASEISAYNMRQDYSYDDVPNEISISTADHSSTPSTRLTPVKFSYAHPIARFSAGGMLITAVPSQANPTLAASVKIQSMQMIMENEASYQELKHFQGPLIRGQTHKNDVVDFCNQKIKYLKKKDDIVDRDSYILLWELMILLLRQNGSVAGSDIAELLLRDHEVLRPHAVPIRHTIETPQGEQPLPDVNDSSSQSHAGDISSPDEGIVVLHDKSSLNTSQTVDVDQVTRKFREFLLFGHKKDALEWAMKHGLWGHALFLASKMDLRTYANVMTRFANSLALNDPLQTLYQLMSGRQPSAVTCVADKKWGDWRPHLAMILSNPSVVPDVDSRSITTLGDTLASRGCLPAAQFCYVMAQVEFGTFEQKNSKLVLLSADHRLSFEEFATNEAIQCTEIYEYAQSLANPGYLLIHLQMYKYLYALRLVEHGFLEEALHYCEVIAGNLQAHPTLFLYDLISDVFKLASTLKYHDPHFLRGQGEFEDQDDPEWLTNLSILVQNYNNILQGQNSQEQIQYEPQVEQAQTVNDQLPPVVDNTSYQNISGPGMQTEMVNSVNNFYQPSNNWNQQSSTVPNTASLSNSQQEIHSYYQGDVINSQVNFHIDSSIPSHEENETTDVPSSPITQSPPFDYYSGSTQQGTESKQSTYEQISYNSSTNHRERRDSALSSGSRFSAGSLSVAHKSSIKERPKTEPKKETKANTQAGKTWLGGIFSRLLPKGPNQMILPDDKNPTIVWDEVQQRWVNKDGNDDDDSNTPLAPPTDMELMGSKSSDKPAVPLDNSMPPIVTSPVNKFQRPKTRGMRQNYVDILNNSGSTTKTNVPPEALFPTSFDQNSSTNMFVPLPVSSMGEHSSDLDNTNPSFSSPGIQTEEQSQVVSAPLMFDPAEFDSRRSNMVSQRHTIGRTGRRTYPT